MSSRPPAVARRTFLGAAAAGTALALGARGLSRARAADRPNVLFLAIDDLNDWSGCLGGHPDTRTPHLDRLAARGTLFTCAHCAAPACNPSRTALLTGYAPSTTGVYHNNQPWRPVLPDAVTLQQQFMAAGYQVNGCGKLFHGGFNDPASWHQYLKAPPHPAPSDLPANGIPKTGHFDWGPVDVPDEAMSDWQLADWAIDQLSRRQDRPLFLACGFFRPHLPWFVPRRYFDRFPADQVTLPTVKDDDLDDVPPAGVKMARPDGDHRKVIESGHWRRAVQAYLASINFVDTCLGRVLDAFDASPYRDDTVVVLWSDHGWHLGEKLHWRKFALWEEATRNQLMVVAPTVTPIGAVCPQPVSLLDVYPTLVDLCGLPPREDLQGLSLLPQLRDPRTVRERPAVTTHGRGNHSVRDLRWRYIRYADGGEELYDHDADELEWTNLASRPEHRGTVARLARWLPEEEAENAPVARGGNDNG